MAIPHKIPGALWATYDEQEQKVFLSGYKALALALGLTAAMGYSFFSVDFEHRAPPKEKIMQAVVPPPPPPPVEEIKPEPPPPPRRVEVVKKSQEPPLPKQQTITEKIDIPEPSPAPSSSGVNVALPFSEKTDLTPSAPVGVPNPPPPQPKPVETGGIRRGVVPTYKEECKYPREAIRAGIEGGELVALLSIDESGAVTNVDITQANPRGVFEKEVRRCMSRWKFKGDGGRYIAEAPFSFKLVEQ